MERTVQIDGKEIKLKANALLPLVYKAAFGVDIFKVQSTIFSIYDRKGISLKSIGDVDCVGIMQVIWSMAKIADNSIPEFEKWLEEFDSFPIFDIFNEVQDLFLNNIASTSNIKNAKAAGN